VRAESGSLPFFWFHTAVRAARSRSPGTTTRVVQSSPLPRASKADVPRVRRAQQRHVRLNERAYRARLQRSRRGFPPRLPRDGDERALDAPGRGPALPPRRRPVRFQPPGEVVRLPDVRPPVVASQLGWSSKASEAELKGIEGGDRKRGVGGETRRAKSLRNGVHHADGVVWGPV